MKLPILLILASLAALASAGFPFVNDLSKILNGAKGTVGKASKTITHDIKSTLEKGGQAVKDKALQVKGELEKMKNSFENIGNKMEKAKTAGKRIRQENKKVIETEKKSEPVVVINENQKETKNVVEQESQSISFTVKNFQNNEISKNIRVIDFQGPIKVERSQPNVVLQQQNLKAIENV